MNAQHPATDAWLLLATIYAAQHEPASLSDVIAAADYIQHAIVTFEEMQSALARLTAGSFLSLEAGKLSPSAKTMAFYRSFTKASRPVYREQEDIREFLEASSADHAAKPQDANRGTSCPLVSREQFDQAVSQYLSRFQGPKARKKKAR